MDVCFPDSMFQILNQVLTASKQTGTINTAPDKAFFSVKKVLIYFSYFSTKTYVVVLIRRPLPRGF